MNEPRTIILANQSVKTHALTLIGNLPVDGTLELVIQPRKKTRSQSQNALMWGARIKDISTQAWVRGRQFSSEVWHDYFKGAYLPEGNEENFTKLVKNPDKYKKWEESPSGQLVLVGSTTQLTTLGMTEYMTQVEAYASQALGVMFSADRIAA